jgi:hypothetical protein
MRVILIETPLTRDLHIAGADLTLSNLAELDDLLHDIARPRKR